MFYSASALQSAGVDPASLSTLSWNPQDGGTFEKLIARLTIDKKGKRGDEPGFDKANIKTYGIAGTGAGGDGFGQIQWASFTGSNGWQATDKNPWGTKFTFDSPSFQDTIGWYFGLIQKGYMPPISVTSTGVSTTQQIASGNAAIGLDGSWTLTEYGKAADSSGKKLEIGIAPHADRAVR